MDGCGRLWTPMELKASRSGLCGRLWTPVDGACRSTDQEVGGSSPSGCTNETLYGRGFCRWVGRRPSDVWEPSAEAIGRSIDAPADELAGM